MKMDKVVIVVSGGTVSYVAGTQAHTTVVIHDVDAFKARGLAEEDCDALLDNVAKQCTQLRTFGSREFVGAIETNRGDNTELTAEIRYQDQTGEDGKLTTKIDSVFGLFNDGSNARLFGEQADISVETYAVHIPRKDEAPIVIYLPGPGNSDYNELVKSFDSFDDAMHALLDCRVDATFVPQAWVDQKLMEIDGRKTFNALEVLIGMELAAVKELFTGYDFEILASRVPERMRHTGPFNVEIFQEDLVQMIRLYTDGAGCLNDDRMAGVSEDEWLRFSIAVANLLKAKASDPAPKSRIKCIELERQEGVLAKWKSSTLSGASRVLRDWSHTAPKGGAYDKVQCKITWENAISLRLRYDLMHPDSGNNVDLESNLKRQVNYWLGQIVNPDFSSDKQAATLETFKKSGGYNLARLVTLCCNLTDL